MDIQRCNVEENCFIGDEQDPLDEKEDYKVHPVLAFFLMCSVCVFYLFIVIIALGGIF